MSTKLAGLDRTLPLVEYFYSVQGEGRNAGRAAFFIRFAGCNLDCVFADGSICDTPWRKVREKISMREILHHVDSAVRSTTSSPVHQDQWPMVILTGGEPTMAVLFDDLVMELSTRRVYVAVESNGTIYRTGLHTVDWLVVSPKDQVGHGNPLTTPDVDPRVHTLVKEYRYVISGKDAPVPTFRDGTAVHYVSPALEADGTGQEILIGKTPRFVPGAVERCLEIVQSDPRWRISLQTHKWLLVR